MNIRKLLLVFAFAPILMSCSKDDDDFIDQFVGSYMCKVTGLMTIQSSSPIYIPMDIEGSNLLTVTKLSSNSLVLTFMGSSMEAMVDGDGTLTIKQETGPVMQHDPDSGTTLNMNLTVTYSGTITSRSLTIMESYSGNATITQGEDAIKGAIGGSVVYFGTK